MKIGRVYKIIHNQSNICYVGSTFNTLRDRWQRHRHSFARYLNKNGAEFSIYPYFKEYGIENFKILLIKEYEVIDRRHLEVMEQLWINKLKSVNQHSAFAITMYKLRKCLLPSGLIYSNLCNEEKKDKSQNIDTMEKFNKIIDNSDIADGSKALYKRQIKKLYEKLPKKTFTILKDVPLIQKTIEEIYTNKESQKTMYNVVILITRLYKGLPHTLYEEYRKIRDNLKGEIKEQKSENVIQDENKWMSLDELKAVPTKIQQEIESKYGSLFIPKSSLSQMKKADRIKYIKSFLNWGFIYTVINYPLRLDYFNLPLTKTEGENHMLRDGNKLTLYLNKFKNIKSMGPQVIEYDDRTRRVHGTSGADPMIIKYLDQVEAITDSKPTHLLWHVVKNEMKLFSRKEVYSHHIINIIKKYTGKSINNNTIRKIWETSLIQSPEYRQMTNKEKDKAHAKLLHSTATANETYNKIHERMRQMKLCKCCGQVVK